MSYNRNVYVGFYTSSQFTDGSEVEVQQITDDDLALLDESSLTKRFRYTIPASDFPQGGIRLLPNPIEANNGNQFLVTVEQENGQNATTAYVTVKNLSMTQSVNGNVIAYLLDSGGRAIETKLLATSSGELLTLQGQESITKNIIFTKLGEKVVAEYFTAEPDACDVEISDIKLLGIDIDFDSNITDYSLSSINLYSTTIVAAAKRTSDLVEIRNASGSI